LLPDELRSLMQASARAFPTTGAGTDENGLPVPMCHAPDGSDQLQCYCSVGLCGAGMLDAAASVRAATGTVARIGSEPEAPVVGDTLRLSAAASLVGAGRSLVAYDWTLPSNPGVVAGFSGSSIGPDAELLTTGVGTVTVNLVVTDDAGQRSSVQRSIEVSAAVAGGGGGGGASSLLWVSLLGLAVAALLHARRRAATAAKPVRP
jgi:serine protease